MVNYEVKEIHAHREIDGKLEYCVEWVDFKGKWDFVQRQDMRCAELLKAYNKKQELIKYWQKQLEAGNRNMETDINLAKKPTELPVITDFRSKVVSAADDGLPIISSSREKEDEEGDKAPPTESKVKTIFEKRLRLGVPHLLCELENGELTLNQLASYRLSCDSFQVVLYALADNATSGSVFPWIQITELEGSKLLEQFYLIEQILKTEAAKQAVVDLAEEESGSKRKRSRIFSSSSSSSSSTKSPNDGMGEDISGDEDDDSSSQSNSSSSMLCGICDKSFATPGKWNDHKRNHNRYECYLCNKDFNWRSLPSYLLTQHKLKGRCCECGEKVKNPASCKKRCMATAGKLAKKKTTYD